MRDGSHGPDMFEACRLRGVAAITYNNLFDVDLTPYNRKTKPPEWVRQKNFSPGTMAKFAFDMCCGDLIFVKDSLSQRIIGCGLIQGQIGERAYRFEGSNPIRTGSGIPWRHYVNVTWFEDFIPIDHVARAALVTVLELRETEVQQLGTRLTSGLVQSQSDVQKAAFVKLIEDSYFRYSPAKRTEITPRHNILSNQFRDWILDIGASSLTQEDGGIDTTFGVGALSLMVEFKICYGGNTIYAIRDALGQVFEYNLRLGRKCHDRWLLVLDTAPLAEDIEFIRRLRDNYSTPLFLGWRTEVDQFEFESKWD